MNGCQIITPKQGNPSNSLDFNEEYSLYRFTEKIGDRLPFLLAFAPDMAYLCIAFMAKFLGQRNSLTAVENIFTD